MKTSTTIRTNGAVCIYALLISLALFCGNAMMAQDPLYISQDGNVGIGTISPNATLHVSAPSTTAASLQWGATAGTIFRSEHSELAMGLYNSSPWAYWLQARTDGNTARDIVMQPLGGNVGIGTTSPLAPLQVTANGTRPTNGLYVYNPNEGQNAPICARVHGSAGKPYISLDRENISGWSMGINPTDNSLLFRKTWDFSSNEMMTLGANGNVGIGTTIPDFRMTISQDIIMGNDIGVGSGQLALTSSTDLNKRMVMGYSMGDSQSENGFGFIQCGNYTKHWTNLALQPMSGNVGIGTTSPQQNLSVQGYINVDQMNADLGNTGNGSYHGLSFGSNSGEAIGSVRKGDINLNGLDFYTGYNKSMSITNSGNVGIGTDKPDHKLSIIGDLCYTGKAVTCSDIRWKKDIITLSTALSNVMKLRGVNYYWKKDEYPEQNFTDTRQIGFIGQEIEKIYPEVVLTDKNGYKSVDYSKLTPVLVEAIKELRTEKDAEIAKLNQAITDLRNQNQDLKAEIQSNGKMMKDMKAQIDKINEHLNMTSQK